MHPLNKVTNPRHSTHQSLSLTQRHIPKSWPHCGRGRGSTEWMTKDTDLHSSNNAAGCRMSVSEVKDYDLECSICFSNYNNVFRTPKQLACNHTFCLECLARMNMKAQVAEAIQCPICRSLTRVPKDGLPKLGNNSGVLSCLPEAMQRIQSIRFNRGKGRLFVKKGQWSQKKRGKKKMFASSVSQSLDVGRPSDMDNHQESGQRWWCCVHKSYVTIVIVIMVTLAILISSIWVFVVR